MAEIGCNVPDSCKAAITERIVMRKQEFVDCLRMALNGNVSDAVVTDYMKYYEEYINTEIGKGLSEDMVLDALGDPRLIARTIIHTNSIEEGGASAGYADEHIYSDTRDDGYSYRKKVVRAPRWIWGVLIVLIIFLVIRIVMSVLTFLAPIMIPALVVVFLIKLFRDWLN